MLTFTVGFGGAVLCDAGGNLGEEVLVGADALWVDAAVGVSEELGGTFLLHRVLASLLLLHLYHDHLWRREHTAQPASLDKS